MIFKFKQKPIVVDCFTCLDHVLDYNPIQKASKFYPSWIRSIPKNIIHPIPGVDIERATIKHCVGLNKLMNSGFIIPMWTDVKVVVGKEIEWFSASWFSAGHHGREQYGAEFYPEGTNIKFSSPWRIKSKKGVEFAWMPTPWHNHPQQNKFQVLTGVVDFHYQYSANVNIVAEMNNVLSWEAGDPIAHVVPLTDKPIEIKTHLVDEKEIDKMDLPSPKFKDAYRYGMNKMKEKEKKCPFGFGR